MAGFGFNVEMDASEAAAVTAMLETIALEVKTNRNLSPVIEYVHAEMAQGFDDYMSTTAPTMPESFNHVYEWGMIGIPQGQLWKHVLRGRGGNRVASFEWRASKKTVPIPAIPEGPQGQQLKQIHVFVWKAPVMEYNMAVTIRPLRAKALAFPTGDPENPLKFSRQWVHVRVPGGQATAGKFTGAFSEWFTGSAGEARFRDRIAPVLEADFDDRNFAKFMAMTKKPRTRRFSLSAIANTAAARQEGKAIAEAFMRDRGIKYHEAAMRRERFFT